MIHLLNEIRTLRNEGKLHTKLLIRTRILFGISVILGGVVVYTTLTRGADWRFSLLLSFGGALAGALFLSHMSPLQWNEEKEVVETGRMGTLGYITIALYIATEVGLRTALKDFYPAFAVTYLLAGVCGVLVGRTVGTLVEIHRVYRAAHP